MQGGDAPRRDVPSLLAARHLHIVMGRSMGPPFESNGSATVTILSFTGLVLQIHQTLLKWYFVNPNISMQQ